MLVFVITISVLIFLALLFVVPTLFKKAKLQENKFDELNVQIAKDRLKELKQLLENGDLSQEDFDKSKQELEDNLALDLSVPADGGQQGTEKNSTPAAFFMLIAVPVASVLIYMQIGNFDAVEGFAQKQAAHNATEQAPQLSMEDAAKQLAARLQNEPDNAEGWFMLARTYMTMERYVEAANAYKKTVDLVGENANVLIRYADAIAMSRQGKLTGEPRQLLEKAITLEPENQQGLWLAGMAAMEDQEFKVALKRFLILQPMLANSEYLSQLHNLIARAEQNLKADEIEAVAKEAAAEVKAKQVATAEIEVSVSLSEDLKNKVSSDDVVFVYAKAIEGPPMPLAASKQSVSSLPFTVSLNDQMAMIPDMKLSNFDRVIVGAKISKSGAAGSTAGDLYGEVSGIEVKTGQRVSLVIDKIK